MAETRVPNIRRIDKNKKKKIKLPVLNMLLVFACTFLLMISTFIQIKIVHPIIPHDILSNNTLTNSDFWYKYVFIPQIPAVMFVTGLMGRKLGITSVIIYILIGLFVAPIFAIGGGLRYIAEYGFGYILAYVPAVFLAGSIIKDEFSFKNIFKSVLVGVLVIHLIGVFYMLFIAAIRHGGFEFIKGWILSQTLLKIPYDYVIGVFAMTVAKYGNKYVNYLIR